MSEKEKHIEWMDEQDAARMREAKQHDFASEVELEEVFMRTSVGLGILAGQASNPLVLKELRLRPRPAAVTLW